MPYGHTSFEALHTLKKDYFAVKQKEMGVSTLFGLAFYLHPQIHGLMVGVGEVFVQNPNLFYF